MPWVFIEKRLINPCVLADLAVDPWKSQTVLSSQSFLWVRWLTTKHQEKQPNHIGLSRTRDLGKLFQLVTPKLQQKLQSQTLSPKKTTRLEIGDLDTRVVAPQQKCPYCQQSHSYLCRHHPKTPQHGYAFILQREKTKTLQNHLF